MPTEALRLEVASFAGQNHWRWVLKDANGAFLADHEVNLDQADTKYQALFDLPGYLDHFAAPDKREADERRLLDEVGAWIGATVLGQGIGAKIIARRAPPIIVRVLVPPEAERLVVLPLEIAHVRGKPLSLQGVSLVFEVVGDFTRAVTPVGERLRILALFSLPPTGSPLNLRRERQMLRKLVRRLVGNSRLAVDLRVLQYGVTRDNLREALEDGEGWDVIHFSGHGLPGALVLERPDGQADLITAADMNDLLQLASQRLKLVLLSACLSAAASIEQILNWIGEANAGRRAGRKEAPPVAEEERPAPTVARVLASSLDCAVLAMRYSVEDEFSIELAETVYDSLFTKKQTLPRAVQLALAKASSGIGGAKLARAAGPLSVAAPALFGARAADLSLVPPKLPLQPFTPPDTGLAYFPGEPAQFVGRVSAMTRGSAALAAESTKSGVLFYGMAGAGKSSCAIELAYHHEAAGRFQAFVWYRAPEVGKDVALALRDFAVAMENQLAGFTMVHVVDDIDTLRNWLPRLTEMLERRGVLLLLDNLESLLTSTRQWRDERWGLLIDALLMPGGLSRAVLTSRIRPADLPESIEIVALHALPLDEAVLLMRELPNFRRLLDGTAPGVSVTAGRGLLHRTLRLVQGHPKLIEFAERLALEPQRLSAQLDRADAAEGKGELDAFFREGETRFDAEAFTAALRDWTAGIVSQLPESARTFFHFLCAVEEADRESWILENNWTDLWKGIGRSEPAPSVTDVLRPLVAAGLAEKKRSELHAEAFTLTIHPGVAEAGRSSIGPELQAAVDKELAATWEVGMGIGLETYTKKPGAGPIIVRAGLGALPYLSRLRRWEMAAQMIDRLVAIDSAPATIAAVLPYARLIAEAATGTERELIDHGLLARILLEAGRTLEAEKLLRTIMARAVEQDQFALASALAQTLVNLLRGTGRTREALAINEQTAEYTRRAGFGPWTQLADEGGRLQILSELGEYDEVMRCVTELNERMKLLPDPPDSNEPISVWNIRETTWDIGHTAALALKQWQQALDINAEILRSQQGRAAPQLEQAKTRFNDYGPLLRLGRYEDARSTLVGCRAVFKRENLIQELGMVFTAFADLEDELGHTAAARRFEEAALRFHYIAGNPSKLRSSHFNLSKYIILDKGTWRDALAHRIAATCIAVLTRSGRAYVNIAALSNDLQRVGPAALSDPIMRDFAALSAMVEQVEGVRFREIVERLAPQQITGDDLLKQIVALAIETTKQEGKAAGQNNSPKTKSGPKAEPNVKPKPKRKPKPKAKASKPKL
ncbi:MAG TPA: CHAT domain-containing protein [Xanthobacteraceae bacterium]|nr:CHAT domain-containing protein [Xanthobacteraceae bacterium]